jgi:alkanesulfonate monooxygenase SsuD/methylene tetrahydromethanopterin reductase-like flavin-dependent oxidoreductase (luciferase family)
VPLWHPVLLAEQVGTLATLAAAPFVVQVGMGSGADQFAAMGVPAAVERAARLGDAWYGNADLTLATGKPLVDRYREACDRHGVVPARIAIRKDVFVAEDASFAERVGDALVARGYRGFERGAVAYGDPHQVAEQLQAFVALGFTDVVLRTMRPLSEAVDPGAAIASMGLAGEVRTLLRGATAASPGT